jgi:hypothetical protein
MSRRIIPPLVAHRAKAMRLSTTATMPSDQSSRQGGAFETGKPASN